MEFSSITIEGLRTTGQRYTVNDNCTKGLHLRVESSGTKTWYFRGSINGIRVQRRLGLYPRISVRAARREVASLRESVGKENPKPFKTLDEMFVSYLRHANVNLSVSRMERSLRKHPAGADNGIFSVLPDRPEDVQVSDITQYVDILHSRTSLADGSIRNMLTMMKRTYSYWMLRGHVQTNPFAVFFDLNRSLRGQDQMIKPSEPRKRYLAPEQIDMALDVLEGELFDIVRLALLTGCRREELRLLHASEICLAEGTISFPAERKKNRKPHKLALCALAHRIVAPRLFGGGYLFPTQAKNQKAALTRALSYKCSFSPHDIRRTVSRDLGLMGCPLPIISKILSHTPREDGVAQVTMDYADEQSNHRLSDQRIWLDKLAEKYTTAFPRFAVIV